LRRQTFSPETMANYLVHGLHLPEISCYWTTRFGSVQKSGGPGQAPFHKGLRGQSGPESAGTALGIFSPQEKATECGGIVCGLRGCWEKRSCQARVREYLARFHLPYLGQFPIFFPGARRWAATRPGEGLVVAGQAWAGTFGNSVFFPRGRFPIFYRGPRGLEGPVPHLPGDPRDPRELGVESKAPDLEP